jgi:hypothetical protein
MCVFLWDSLRFFIQGISHPKTLLFFTVYHNQLSKCSAQSSWCRWSATTIGTFTVQCNLCGKWRIIPTKEQYQAIGERILQHPWVCEEGKAWREGASCRDPSDISEDEPSILWAVDKHNIPKPPPGFNRKVVLRGELSRNFADV